MRLRDLSDADGGRQSDMSEKKPAHVAMAASANRAWDREDRYRDGQNALFVETTHCRARGESSAENKRGRYQ